MTADDDELRRELATISAEYRSSLPQRVAELEAAWSAVRRGEGDADTLRALLRGLHLIAGSALTFGMPALSTAAAVAEDWIEPYSARGESPAAGDRDAFEPLLAAVRQAAQA